MSVTRVLITLAGEVSLLLWGVHMVQSGVLRAYGPELRTGLRVGLRHRLAAFLAGLGITAAIQSSTATAMMTGSFLADRLMPLTTALAIMLGANVGSALIVKVLSFNTSLIYPILLCCGLIGFRRRHPRIRNLGRAAIGMGLVLLSLHMLVDTVAPTSINSAELAMLTEIVSDPVIALLLAAIITAAAHSSVAIVLVVMSLAGTGLIGPPAALAMVLGANLGSALNPVLIFARGDPAGLRLALGNLLSRLAGCAIMLPILPSIVGWLSNIDAAPAGLTANFHVAFNLTVALTFMIPLPLIARILLRLAPDRVQQNDPGSPQHLDPTALRTPGVALANAARETLRMVDVVDGMLQGAHQVFRTNDRKRADEIRRMDDVLDRLHSAVERYVTQLGSSKLTPTEAQRFSAVLAFSVNLEHAGDIIERSLMAIAAKKIKGRFSLSPEAMDEIDAMFVRLSCDLQLAAAVFISGDPDSARLLFEAKEEFRNIERRSSENHIERMCAGEFASLETSALVLDMIRDLKRIAGHIAATAQPVFATHHLLRASRLAPAK